MYNLHTITPDDLKTWLIESNISKQNFKNFVQLLLSVHQLF